MGGLRNLATDNSNAPVNVKQVSTNIFNATFI
jgi:hypothetical protein